MENRSQRRGRLFLLSGPSGVGKKTLLDRVISCPSLNLVISISVTTRSKRAYEKDGVDYFFVSKEQFLEKIKNGLMLEWAEFFGNYYGTPKDWVDKQLDNGVNVLLEIDTAGFFQVKEKYSEVFSIFVLPPSLEELERRIRNRSTDSEEHIIMRMEKAKQEILESKFFLKRIVNDDLDRATNELKELLLKEISSEN